MEVPAHTARKKPACQQSGSIIPVTLSYIAFIHETHIMYKF
jgi:hypothetical protein